MQIWQAVLLGLVEGVTEFLPVSSTGHLILVSKLLALPVSDFLTTFTIVIQAFAILAVIVVYAKKIFSSLKQLELIITAFFPTVILGIIFYSKVKLLLSNEWITITALITGGIFFWILELLLQNRPKTTILTRQKAFLIGIGQSCSMIPGVSRSAASLFTGMLVGLNRQQAVEFSFLLAIPTILSATAYDVIKTQITFTPQEVVLLIVGGVTAFISALLSITWFLRYISRHSFVPFAIYRIAIGLIFAAFML